MRWRATHLLHPEKIRTVERTSENTIEEQSRTSENTREEQSRTSENTREEPSRTSENTRTSKLSPLERRGRKKSFFKIQKSLDKNKKIIKNK